MKINFNTPIKPALGLISNVVGPKVGIELEYEECNNGDIDKVDLYKYWDVDIDHSLRNGGLEFISKVLKQSDIPDALSRITNALEQGGGVVTKRCGVHVHLNVSDLTFGQLWKITTYYTLVEALIFKEYADGREENHFCVPMFANTVLQQQFYKDAVALHRGINKRKKRPSGGMAMAGGLIAPKHLVPLRILQTPKYAAMNVSSLATFGTLEFRQMRGSRDMNKIRRWANFLIRLREAALHYDCADDVLFEYENNGLTNLCRDIGLPINPDVLPEDMSDSIDGAFVMVGHPPTKQTDLQWEIG